MMNTVYKNLMNRLANTRFLSYWAVFAMDVVISTLCTLLSAIIVSFISKVPMPAGIIGGLTILGFVTSILGSYIFGTYKSVIRHSSFREVWHIILAVFAEMIMMYILLCVLYNTRWLYLMPFRTTFIPSKKIVVFLMFNMMITFIGLVGIRALMITFYDALLVRMSRGGMRVLVYGVGDKSVALETRLRQSPHYSIVGFLTVGHGLPSYKLSGLPVKSFAGKDDFASIASSNNVKGVLFASYKDAKKEKDSLISYCEELGLKILITPNVDELDENGKQHSFVREIKIEDLLGRDEIKINIDEITSFVKGKTVMVTGAAGSIGSELCRQLARLGVGELVLFDNAETPMHNLRLELEGTFPQLKFVPFIGDVRQKERLRVAFELYNPRVVFHAAAYKHVPLMEENPCEAVLVNVVGTRYLADLCVEFGVEKMVMISTDKAVNPTNVMGASKRLAEIYVQSLGMAIQTGKVKGVTKFVTTRFGNVLGSNGSVIPRFREQIANGGPVTVTHPDIVRFFMTIPEACRLVMEAATLPTANKICVFDMGEAVKISDLARRMITLAGLRPDIDIQIRYTGLRPGEKLYEEVLSNEENTMPTDHAKIRLAKVREYDYSDLTATYDKFFDLSYGCKVHDTVRLMKEVVPEYVSRNSEFEQIDHELGKDTTIKTA